MKLVKTGEAARILGTDRKTIRRWADRGLLKVVRHPMNNHRLLSAEDVEALQEKFTELEI